MKRSRLDDILLDVGARDADNDGEALSDDTLRAYRENRLPDAERERVEAVLSASTGARRRLAELAGVGVQPPPGLREAVLGGGAAQPRRQRSLWLGLAAAVVAAGMLGPFVYRALDRPVGADAVLALPAGLGYSVRVEGLARVRSADGVFTADALPDTRVRIVVEPEGEAVAGLGFFLYREDGGRLLRLSGDELEVEASRGAAFLTASAGWLVGSAPGEYELLLLVAREGAEPPDQRRLPELTAGEQLRQASAGLVYPVVVQLLDETHDK